MPNLHKGIKDFKTGEYLKYKSLFKNLKNEQHPHTLFIGCSDSRVVPNLITKTLPGEIFVIRNVANIVPPYRTPDEFLSTVSAIEYAIQVLNIENVVICGHSNCGGCHALFFDDKDFSEIPNVKKWLTLDKTVKDEAMLLINKHSHLNKYRITELFNVIYQLKNIKKYPYVASKLEKNKINVLGWYYNIESGGVYQYNEDVNMFSLIC